MRIGIDAHIILKEHKRYDRRIAKYTEDLILNLIDSDKKKEHAWGLFFDSCSTGYIPFPRRAYSVYVSRKDYYDISLCAEGRKRKQCVCANVHAWCAGCICPAVPAGEA